MKSLSMNSPWNRSSAWARGVALISLAAGAWALSLGTAHARGGHGDDVYWSVGVSTPGVSVGVSNAPPVVVRQRPVVIHQRPVVIERPYRYERRVVVVPQPVYYRGYGPRWQERRWQERHGHWDNGRHGHRDDRRGNGRH